MPGGLLIEKEGNAWEEEFNVIMERKQQGLLTYITFTITSFKKKILSDNLIIPIPYLFSQFRHLRYLTSCHQLIIHVHLQNFYTDNFTNAVLKICNDFLNYKKPSVFIKMKKGFLNNYLFLA